MSEGIFWYLLEEYNYDHFLTIVNSHIYHTRRYIDRATVFNDEDFYRRRRYLLTNQKRDVSLPISNIVEFYQSIHIVLDTNILIEVQKLENFVKKHPFSTYVFPRVVMAELSHPVGKDQITFECGRIQFNNPHFKRIFGQKKIVHQTTKSMKRVNRRVGPNNNNDKDHNDTLIGYFCKEYQEEFPEIQVYLLTRDGKFINRCGQFGVTAGYFAAISKLISEQYESHCIKKLDIRNQDMSFSCSAERMSV